MKFEVNKFLALTALLATATASAVGCSSTDAKKAPSSGGGGGGEAGSVEPSAGSGATPAEAGAAGAAGAQSEAGQGGTGEAGASEGGAAGAPVEACIGESVGQAGAADGATPCDMWARAGTPDCGAEDGNWAGQGCLELYNTGVYRPSVIDAYNTCAEALADTCDQDSVIGCANGLIGRACAQETTAEACAAVATYCPMVTICTGVMNLLTPEGQAAVADCMDPASEFYQAPTDDCDVNLKYCANLPIPAQPVP